MLDPERRAMIVKGLLVGDGAEAAVGNGGRGVGIVDVVGRRGMMELVMKGSSDKLLEVMEVVRVVEDVDDDDEEVAASGEDVDDDEGVAASDEDVVDDDDEEAVASKEDVSGKNEATGPIVGEADSLSRVMKLESPETDNKDEVGTALMVLLVTRLYVDVVDEVELDEVEVEEEVVTTEDASISELVVGWLSKLVDEDETETSDAAAAFGDGTTSDRALDKMLDVK